MEKLPRFLLVAYRPVRPRRLRRSDSVYFAPKFSKTLRGTVRKTDVTRVVFYQDRGAGQLVYRSKESRRIVPQHLERKNANTVRAEELAVQCDEVVHVCPLGDDGSKSAKEDFRFLRDTHNDQISIHAVQP